MKRFITTQRIHAITLAFIAVTIVLLSSCSTSKQIVSKTDVKTKKAKNISNAIVSYAMAFKGAPYKWGGLTRQGMDCSGLVYKAFKKHQIDIPRTSLAMSKTGKDILLRQVSSGDLLFFKTSSKQINHVGLVVESKNAEIKFIHATTKRGVIVSKLSENYWKKAFQKAKRVL